MSSTHTPGEESPDDLDKLYKLKESIDKNCPSHNQLYFATQKQLQIHQKEEKEE